MKTMLIMRCALLGFGFFAMTAVSARSDVRDGNAIVKPVKNDKFSIDGATLGKAELFGYISDLMDREQLTGVVLKSGGNPEQLRVVGSIARTLQLKAFEQDGRDLKPIDLPATEPVPPPPPIESAIEPAVGEPAVDGEATPVPAPVPAH